MEISFEDVSLADISGAAAEGEIIPGSLLDVSYEVEVDVNNNSESDEAEKCASTNIEIPSTSTPIAAKKKTYTCQFEGCSFSSPSSGNLSRHRRSVHEKEKKQCTKCDKSYASDFDLQSHVRVMHEDSPLMCEFCSATFHNRSNLRRHRVMKHQTESAKFLCDTCGKRFYEREVYIGHMNKHMGSKPYSCDMCSMKFGYQSCLRKHIPVCPKSVEKKEHRCDICGAVLNSKNVLLDHMQGKHGDKKYTCACGKSFSWRPSLGRHKKHCKST